MSKRRWRAWLLVALVLGTLSQAGRFLVLSEPLQNPDAIIMLASHEWERIPAAVKLARAYPTATVLLTVPAVVTELNCYRCLDRPDWFRVEGIAPERIHVITERVRNTHDEALATLAFWERSRFNHLAVVTSPYHARRSLATFRHVFQRQSVQIGIYPASDDSEARPNQWWMRWDDVRYVMYEWAAVAYYRAKFGVPMLGATGLETTPRRRGTSDSTWYS